MAGGTRLSIARRGGLWGGLLVGALLAHPGLGAAAEPAGPRTGAVLGQGAGSGAGVPAAVLRALASPRLRAYLSAGAGAEAGAGPGSGTEDDGEAAVAVAKEAAGFFPKVELRGKFKERAGYPLAERGGYSMSCYWLAWESEYASEPYDVDIYTRQGFRIGRFPRAYIFELKMEGSGILRDGRVINYDGACSYGIGTCFTQLDPREHPLGQGGQRRVLTPFKSVAVDPRFVPLGTTLYLPELRGLVLPNGTTHDGCVRADDTGGNIRRRELDFFVESYDNYKLLEDRLWNDHHVTPHIEEPRCDYLRTFDPTVDRKSEATDWLALHKPKAPPPAARGKKAGPARPSLVAKAKPKPSQPKRLGQAKAKEPSALSSG